eukprot:g3200.t1
MKSERQEQEQKKTTAVLFSPFGRRREDKATKFEFDIGHYVEADYLYSGSYELARVMQHQEEDGTYVIKYLRGQLLKNVKPKFLRKVDKESKEFQKLLRLATSGEKRKRKKSEKAPATEGGEKKSFLLSLMARQCVCYSIDKRSMGTAATKLNEVSIDSSSKDIHRETWNVNIEKVKTAKEEWWVEDAKKRLPLHYACIKGSIDIIELFVTDAENMSRYMNNKDTAGATPLAYACAIASLYGSSDDRKQRLVGTGALKCIKVLVHQGCNFEGLEQLFLSKSKVESTSIIHWATRTGETKLIEHLLAKSDSSSNPSSIMHMRSKHGWTPLMSAALCRHSSTIEKLLGAYGKDVAFTGEGRNDAVADVFAALAVAMEANNIVALFPLLEFLNEVVQVADGGAIFAAREATAAAVAAKVSTISAVYACQAAISATGAICNVGRGAVRYLNRLNSVRQQRLSKEEIAKTNVRGVVIVPAFKMLRSQHAKTVQWISALDRRMSEHFHMAEYLNTHIWRLSPLEKTKSGEEDALTVHSLLSSPSAGVHFVSRQNCCVCSGSAERASNRGAFTTSTYSPSTDVRSVCFYSHRVDEEEILTSRDAKDPAEIGEAPSSFADNDPDRSNYFSLLLSMLSMQRKVKQFERLGVQGLADIKRGGVPGLGTVLSSIDQETFYDFVDMMKYVVTFVERGVVDGAPDVSFDITEIIEGPLSRTLPSTNWALICIYLRKCGVRYATRGYILCDAYGTILHSRDNSVKVPLRVKPLSSSLVSKMVENGAVVTLYERSDKYIRVSLLDESNTSGWVEVANVKQFVHSSFIEKHCGGHMHDGDLSALLDAINLVQQMRAEILCMEIEKIFESLSGPYFPSNADPRMYSPVLPIALHEMAPYTWVASEDCTAAAATDKDIALKVRRGQALRLVNSSSSSSSQSGRKAFRPLDPRGHPMGFSGVLQESMVRKHAQMYAVMPAQRLQMLVGLLSSQWSIHDDLRRLAASVVHKILRSVDRAEDRFDLEAGDRVVFRGEKKSDIRFGDVISVYRTAVAPKRDASAIEIKVRVASVIDGHES